MADRNPAYYAKYPMHLLSEAEEQDILSVSGEWRLPEEYLYFLKRYVPVSVAWSTDQYMSLTIYGAKDLLPGQSGYNYNHVTDETIADWPIDYLVIASDEGDPYCMDLSRGDTVIYTARHGAGSWDFSVAYDHLNAFLQSVLLPRSDEEDGEDEELDDYAYFNVLLTGPGADKVKTLAFIRKRFSCDFAQAKAYLAQLPLPVYKGIEEGAVKVEDQLLRIGADYEKRPISWEEFIARP
ncbi:SMI1/KNR4 family protein [Paenibacillus methanolicus]|nr:SMI1/KNR4 family protein [Paenibacillus methanolicus]